MACSKHALMQEAQESDVPAHRGRCKIMRDECISIGDAKFVGCSEVYDDACAVPSGWLCYGVAGERCESTE